MKGKKTSKKTLRKLDRLRKMPVALVVACALAVVLVGSQVERFARRGTVLGYQLRTVHVATKTIANTSSVGVSFGSSAHESFICQKISSHTISSILHVAVEPPETFLPDRTTPYLVSSCVYLTKPVTSTPTRSVSLLYRQLSSSASAAQTLTSLKKLGHVTVVPKLGDEAYYNATANQVTVRKDNEVVSVTVTPASAGQVASQAAALQIVRTVIQ